jgi:hypothetical protein
VGQNLGGVGDSVRVTAVVSGEGTGAPTGSVRVLAGGRLAATVALGGSGLARAKVPGLAVGGHALEAVSHGDDLFAPSSACLTVDVRATTTLTLTAPEGSMVFGQPIEVVASARSVAGPPAAGGKGLVTHPRSLPRHADAMGPETPEPELSSTAWASPTAAKRDATPATASPPTTSSTP